MNLILPKQMPLKFVMLEKDFLVSLKMAKKQFNLTKLFTLQK